MRSSTVCLVAIVIFASYFGSETRPTAANVKIMRLRQRSAIDSKGSKPNKILGQDNKNSTSREYDYYDLFGDDPAEDLSRNAKSSTALKATTESSQKTNVKVLEPARKTTTVRKISTTAQNNISAKNNKSARNISNDSSNHSGLAGIMRTVAEIGSDAINTFLRGSSQTADTSAGKHSGNSSGLGNSTGLGNIVKSAIEASRNTVDTFIRTPLQALKSSSADKPGSKSNKGNKNDAGFGNVVRTAVNSGKQTAETFLRGMSNFGSFVGGW